MLMLFSVFERFYLLTHNVIWMTITTMYKSQLIRNQLITMALSEIGNISQRVSLIQLVTNSDGKRFQSFRSSAIFTESERSSVSALTAARNLIEFVTLVNPLKHQIP